MNGLPYRWTTADAVKLEPANIQESTQEEKKRQASHLTTVPVRHGAACAILTVVDEGGPNCVLARGDSPGIKRGRYRTLSRYDTNGS